MKIAIIFKPDAKIQLPSIGGMSNFVYFLSKGLADKGHQVTVFCSQNSKLAPKVKAVKCKTPEQQINIYKAGDKFYNFIEKKFKWPRDIVNECFGNLSERFHNKINFFLSAFAQVNYGDFDVVHVVNHEALAHYPAFLMEV